MLLLGVVMRKISLFLTCLFVFGVVSACFAQSQKQTINKIANWREDRSCGAELGQLIRTRKDDAVVILTGCCKNHKTRCIETSYTSYDNKTLLYTAIEAKAYEVARFLFNLSRNYVNDIDAPGKRKDYTRQTPYIDFIETEEDKTSKTALMLACSNGDLTGTKLLLDYGASLFKKNETIDGKPNKSAYDYAKSAQHKDAGFIEFVQKKYKEQLELYGLLENEEQNNYALPKRNLTSKQDFADKNYQEQFL